MKIKEPITLALMAIFERKKYKKIVEMLNDGTEFK